MFASKMNTLSTSRESAQQQRRENTTIVLTSELLKSNKFSTISQKELDDDYIPTAKYGVKNQEELLR